METYSKIISLIGENLIKGMFISVLFIIATQKLSKSKLETQRAILIIEWVLIGYATLNLIYYLTIVVAPEFSAKGSLGLKSRATGPYSNIFWFLLICNIVSPFLLFFRRLQRKIYLVFIITILMSTGWLMESLVIHTISIHRDYSDQTINPYLPSNRELFIILKGAFVGIIITVISNLFPLKTKLNKGSI